MNPKQSVPYYQDKTYKPDPSIKTPSHKNKCETLKDFKILFYERHINKMYNYSEFILNSSFVPSSILSITT